MKINVLNRNYHDIYYIESKVYMSLLLLNFWAFWGRNEQTIERSKPLSSLHLSFIQFNYYTRGYTGHELDGEKKK